MFKKRLIVHVSNNIFDKKKNICLQIRFNKGKVVHIWLYLDSFC